MESQPSAPPTCPGTLLADMSPVPPSSSLRTPPTDAVWQRQRDMFFVAEARRTSRTMLGLGALVQLATFGLLVHAEYPAWRIGALAGLYTAFALGQRLIAGCKLDTQRVS